MKQYIVDAFTDKPFSGNPAAVCVMDKWLLDDTMKALALENNLSETAFIVKEDNNYRLRWFTPEVEIDLCGHGTLASAFVILNFYDTAAQTVTFHTRSGELVVTRQDSGYTMDFPSDTLQEIPVTPDMTEAFGCITPKRAFLGRNLVCVFDNEEQIIAITPNKDKLVQLPGGNQNATALGRTTDCVSRSFCPKHGLLEEPVCGSAHCQIATYWSQQLHKKVITARQASKRGGYLTCDMISDERIALSGQVALVAISEIVAKLD